MSPSLKLAQRRILNLFSLVNPVAYNCFIALTTPKFRERGLKSLTWESMTCFKTKVQAYCVVRSRDVSVHVRITR